jgi:hypothetical protein
MSLMNIFSTVEIRNFQFHFVAKSKNPQKFNKTWLYLGDVLSKWDEEYADG